jgi:hypothetical protein
METERLKQAIQHTVAAIAAPDDARLAAILARLEQAPIIRPAPRRNVWPWLLLAAAGAAAAGGGYWYVHNAAAPHQPPHAVHSGADAEPAPSIPASPPSSLPAEAEAADSDGDQQRNTAIIYRQ